MSDKKVKHVSVRIVVDDLDYERVVKRLKQAVEDVKNGVRNALCIDGKRRNKSSM